MRTFTCDRCGWSADESAADWDRFSKLGACPRCEAKQAGGSWLPAPPRTMAGKVVSVAGFAVLLGGALGVLFGNGPGPSLIRTLGIVGVTAWAFRPDPARPKK